MTKALDEVLEEYRDKTPIPIPKQIRVLSQNIDVKLGDLSSADTVAAWDGVEGQIVIHKHLGKFVAVNALIHELIHALEFLLGLELTEQDIDSLATGIISIIVDNPELVELVQSTVQSK